MASDLRTARQVEAVTFSTTLRGYRLEEVDKLLAQVVETLNHYEAGRARSADDLLTSTNVHRATFRTSLRGYDLDEVDDFLDDVVATLQHYESGATERRRDRGIASARRSSDPAVNTLLSSDSQRTQESHPRSSEERLEQARKWLKRSNSD